MATKTQLTLADRWLEARIAAAGKLLTWTAKARCFSALRWSMRLHQRLINKRRSAVQQSMEWERLVSVAGSPEAARAALERSA